MSSHDISRRAWLRKAAVAGGASLLAGCGGGNDGGGDSGGRETERQQTPPEFVDERTFVTTEFNTIHNINYNPYDRLYYPNQSEDYVFTHTWFNSQKNDVVEIREDAEIEYPGIVTDAVRDGTTVEITVSDEFTWHDGDPLTADALAAKWTLDLLADDRKWQRAFEDVTLEDDRTVLLTVKEGVNDRVLNDFIGGVSATINAKPSVYSEFLPDDGSRGKAAYEDLASFERTTMKGNLISFTATTPPGKEGKTAPVVGMGPFKLVEKGQREMVFERFEEHPHADRINFPRVKFIEYTTNQARYQALLGDNFSGLDLTLTQTVWDQLPDYYRRYTYERYLGHGLAMNYKRFPDHRVRQAFAFAIDGPEVVGNSGLAESLVRPHDRDSGFFGDEDRHVEAFGEGFVDQLTQYDQDTERAAALLEEAGWQRDDGQWYDDEDEKVSITIKTPPTWTEFVNMIQTQVQHLNDFGIDADFQTEELVVYYGQTMIQVDYDMAHWWTGGARDIPWFAYNVLWNALQTIADDHNHPDEYEVPGPIGEHNGDDTFTIDIQEYLDKIARTRTGTDEIQDLHRELAWTYNQMLPVYCLNEVTGVASLDTRTWGGPAPDSEEGNFFFPLSSMNSLGLIKAYEGPGN